MIIVVNKILYRGKVIRSRSGISPPINDQLHLFVVVIRLLCTKIFEGGLVATTIVASHQASG